MNTKLLLLIAFCFAKQIAFSQTKKIAFKSHGGNMANYATALNENLFDMENSNFGAAPNREIIEAKLDSVIFICDTAAILVNSRYCKERYVKINSTQKEKLWRAGREVVYYHPLFSKKHSLDSIKNIIKTQYYFNNAVEGVKFIGYDNNKDSCKFTDFVTNLNIPPNIKSNITNIGNKQKFTMGLSILFFSLLVAYLIKFGNSKTYKLSYA